MALNSGKANAKYLRLGLAAASFLMVAEPAISGQDSTSENSAKLRNSECSEISRAPEEEWRRSKTTENTPASIHHLRRAACAGHRLAIVNLAASYGLGGGVPRDDRKARLWYAEGARRCSPGSVFGLGFMSYAGEGGEKDMALGLALAQLAADVGHDPAATWLFERRGEMEARRDSVDAALQAWLRENPKPLRSELQTASTPPCVPPRP